MLARYINLKAAERRRASLESNIQALPTGQWRLQRFEAVDTLNQACRTIAGNTTPGEKACYLSHRALLTEMLNTGTRDPFMVWEDDVVVGYLTHDAIVNFVTSNPSDAWDLLYTDIVVPDLASMLDLFVRGRSLRTNGRIEVLDLRSRWFAGTTSYLVNPVALPRLVAQLSRMPALDEPLDLLLRRWIHQGILKGHVLFPFVTTVSDEGLNSQIALEGTAGTDLAWTLYRRLIWLERETEALYPLCNQLSSLHADPESSVMGVIAATLLSPRFKPK